MANVLELYFLFVKTKYKVSTNFKLEKRYVVDKTVSFFPLWAILKIFSGFKTIIGPSYAVFHISTCAFKIP